MRIMASTEIFKLNEVFKIYERKIALSSFSLIIKKSEVVALIGPSGAGKTTLLDILAQIIKTDRGEFFIDGKPADHYKDGKMYAQKVGIIRQQFDLVGPLPVIHNVLAGRFADWGFFKSLLSLIDKLYERTSHLSGGELQRVALARLLVQKPEVILADEPVSSLDPARSEDVISLLTQIVKEEGQTLVVSLHSVEYARKYFTRIIAMREGKVYFDLPAGEVTDEVLLELYNLEELRKHGKTPQLP